MDLYSAAQYMKVGYRIRRASWPSESYIDLSEMATCLNPDSLWADDWEVITDGVVSHFPITYSDEVE